MAKIYGIPAELEKIFEPDYSASFDKWQKQEENAVESLRKWCKEFTTSKNPLVGEIFRIPMGDGYANYMVFQTKPLEMIHIPVGDAWSAPEYQTRGVNLQDVKNQVNANKLFSK